VEESKRMHETKWWKSGRDGRKFKEQKIGKMRKRERCEREEGWRKDVEEKNSWKREELMDERTGRKKGRDEREAKVEERKQGRK
jgi:hypothetical protein